MMVFSFIQSFISSKRFILVKVAVDLEPFPRTPGSGQEYTLLANVRTLIIQPSRMLKM